MHSLRREVDAAGKTFLYAKAGFRRGARVKHGPEQTQPAACKLDPCSVSEGLNRLDARIPARAYIQVSSVFYVTW